MGEFESDLVRTIQAFSAQAQAKRANAEQVRLGRDARRYATRRAQRALKRGEPDPWVTQYLALGGVIEEPWQGQYAALAEAHPQESTGQIVSASLAAFRSSRLPP